MDRRRAAGALLALAACIACSAAAPTASNHTALDLYEGAPEGCYYNFQHYGEGDRIMTNEPCLNCTCHNRMLMCYLRVCPFTKPIGQDCTVEKRADQCCPIVTCPDVPVDLLTSTSTTSPAEYGATGLGKLDKYGCSINGKYFPEGSKVPPTPNKPCEHCYCIRNMTTCVMQECTLHVDGCTPIYHKDVCCPVRYSCDHPEDEMPLLDDMSTTVRPTPGFLLTTTTVSPVTQMTQDCVHNDQVIADGASITTEKACEHCYCMKGDIVCVVQECGAPMENEGKNCTSMPPREGQCCPDTYICEGDELSTEIQTESSTDLMLESTLTTLSPPRRGGIEGSGYRNEPSETVNTETPTAESQLEGSGEEEEPTKVTDTYEPLLPGKPLEPEKITPTMEDSDQYIAVTTKAPKYEEPETATKEFDGSSISGDDLGHETIEPQTYEPTTHTPVKGQEEITLGGVTEDEHVKPYDHVTMAAPSTAESYEQTSTESSGSISTASNLQTVQQEQDKNDEYIPVSTSIPAIEGSGTTISEGRDSTTDSEITPIVSSEGISASEYATPSPVIPEDTEKGTTIKSEIKPEDITEKESLQTEGYTATSEAGTIAPQVSEEVTLAGISKDKDTAVPEQYATSTTSIPIEHIEKLTTEPDHAQNTVGVAEEGYIYPHVSSSEETEKPLLTDSEDESGTKVDNLEHASTQASVSAENEPSTVEPDKGLNTIPSETDEETSSQPSLEERTTLSVESKSTEPSIIMHATETQDSDIKSSTAESPMSPETHITRGDQYTITTEPSFRREDEVKMTTEKVKEVVATTIKPEFVDEGLIPTSTHDEKPSPGSDVPTVDEEITTMMPEYIEGLDETVDSKYPTTDSIRETPVVSDTTPEEMTDTVAAQEGGLPSSTEKTVAVTTLAPDVDTQDEPSRIPGEGDCLLNGITYKNNTVVPSTNNCHTGCKCVSSIVKCDPILCSPPPDYMHNCQSIYDTPDSCCPTYVCDHPKETIPPQSDNQMSGTEPPKAPPVIECRGDQCELSEPGKISTVPSEPCTTGDCVPGYKPEIVCGPKGCDDAIQQPQPLQPGHTQISPEKPCEGNDCKVAVDEVSHKIPTEQIPCEGDSCTNVDCGSSDCTPSVVLPPQDSQQAPCKQEEGCQPEEIVPADCTGDMPCRRKDAPVDTTITQKTPLEEETAKVTFDGKEKLSEPTESQVAEHVILDTTPIAQIITEKEHAPTEHPIYDTSDQIIEIDEVTQKIYEPQDISTDEPSITEAEGTEATIEGQEMPIVTKDDTEVPSISEEDMLTKKPEVETDDKQDTEVPSSIPEEYTDKPAIVKEESTAGSLTEAQGETAKPTSIEEEGVTVSSIGQDKQTEKPTVDEENVTNIVEVATEKQTSMPNSIEEEYTSVPDIGIQEQTGKPSLAEEEATEITNVEEHTDKLSPSDEETTKIADVEESTDKSAPSDEEPTKVTDVEEHTDKLAPSDEEPTKISDVEEHTDESVPSDEEPTKVTDVEEHTDKSAPSDEETTKISDVEEHTDKSAPSDEETTKISDVEEHTDKSVPSDEETTKITDVEEHTDESAPSDEEPTKVTDVEEHTDKSAPSDEEPTKITDVEEHTDKSAPSDEEPTKVTDVEEHTDKSAPSDEETTKISDVEEHTDKSAPSDEESTKISDVEEHTDKSVPSDEEPTKVTDVEEHTDKSVPSDEEPTKVTDVEEHTDKSAPSDEEPTKITDVEEHTDKSVPSDEELTKVTDVEEHTDKSVPSDDEPTKIPDVEVHTDKSGPADETTKITDVAEGYTDKPDLVEAMGSMSPVTDVEEQTSMLGIIEDVTTKIPEIAVEQLPDKPSLEEETDTKIPDVSIEEQTGKPSLIDEDDTRMPGAIDQGHTDKLEPTEEVDTNIPDAAEGYTDEPAIIVDTATDMPDIILDKQTSKPALEDQDTITPHIVREDHTDKIDALAEGYTDEPVEEISTKRPIVVEDDSTGKPISTEGEPTRVPDIAVEHPIDMQTIAEESGTMTPDSIVKEQTGKPILVEEESTKVPGFTVEEQTIKPKKEEDTYTPDVVVEEQTEKAVSDEEVPKITDTVDIHTDKPTGTEDTATKLSEGGVEEQTSKPAMVEEADIKTPGSEIEEQTDKSGLVDEEDIKTDLVTENYTDTPAVGEAQGPKETDLGIEEQTAKPAEELTSQRPVVISEEHTDKSVASKEEDTNVTDASVHEYKPDSEEELASTKPTVSLEEQTEEDKPESVEDLSTKKTEEEEHSEKPTSVEDEITKTPDIINVTQDEVKEKPDSTEHDHKEKPGLLEEDGNTDLPILDGEGTEMPGTIEVSDTKKPMLIDESTLAPAEIEYESETKSPIVLEETSSDKPVITDDTKTDDKTKDEPTIHEETTKQPAVETSTKVLETDHTDEPQIPEITKPSKEHEDTPQHPEDDDTRRTEPHKEGMLPGSVLEDHTVRTVEVTETPTIESQTIVTADDSQKPKETKPQEPEVSDIDNQEIVTQTLKEQAMTTRLPLPESSADTTLSPVQDGAQEIYQSPELVTSGQEPLTNAQEVTKLPEYAATTEPVDKMTKPYEQETISEQGEIYTDEPGQEPTVTKSPVNAIIEPQDGEPPMSLDVTVKSPVDEDSTTIALDKDVMGPIAPESHVTDSVTEYSTTLAPVSETVKITEIPEVIEKKTELPEHKPHDFDSEKTTTMPSELEKKTSQPEIVTPKEEEVTSTVISTVTEPVKGFTEVEDAFVTGEGEITTIPYKTFGTEKTDESSTPSTSEMPLSGAKVTASSEESYTTSSEQQTESPIQGVPHKPETSTDLSIEVPTATESSELSEKAPDHLSTVKSESETKTPDTSELETTESPVAADSDIKEKPGVSDEDVDSHGDTTSKLPYSETSTVSDIHITGEQVVTETPESHISVAGTHESKPTESSYDEEHITEGPQTADTQKTTLIPEILEKPEDAHGPESSYDQGVKKQPSGDQISTESSVTSEESHTEKLYTQVSTEASLSLVTEQQPVTARVEDITTEKQDIEFVHETQTEIHGQITDKPDILTSLPEIVSTEDVQDVTKSADQTPAQIEFSETTPYLIELQEHTHKIVDEPTTTSRTDEEEHTYKTVEDVVTPSTSEDEHTRRPIVDTTRLSEEEHATKIQEHLSTTSPSVDYTHKTGEDIATTETRRYSTDAFTEKTTGVEIEASEPSDEISTSAPVSDKSTLSPGLPAETSEAIESSTLKPTSTQDEYDTNQKEVTTAKSIEDEVRTTAAIPVDTEKAPIEQSDVTVPTEKEIPSTQKPLPADIDITSHATATPEDELILSTTKATTIKQEEISTPVHEDKYDKPKDKPTSEIVPPTTTAEIPKPLAEMQPTEEVSPPEEDGHFPPSGTGYGEPDYVEEDQAFGPGTCRYGGKVYVSAQQIPRDDPCDFCFCFRSDIICLQQSCPPPIHGCHEEPIQGFCCPRYECPVSMATTVNVTTTTTTTTTTLPPHFPTHSYKGAAQRRGCQIKGHTYKVGEVVRSSSGPCLHCTCGGDGQMKCDPKACTPEPMLRQMIAAAVSAKRRR